MGLNFTEVVTDSEKKLFEIGPGAFYAGSGWTSVCRFQAAAAAELAGAMGTKDIRRIAEVLDALSQPELQDQLRVLRSLRHLHQDIEDIICGTKPLHGYVMAGVSRGVPGYLVREFWVVDGQVTTGSTEAFELPRGENFRCYIGRPEIVDSLVRDPATWQNGPAGGAERLMAELSSKHPQVGGPIQLVQVDTDGARWIHQLPAQQPAESATTSRITEWVLNAGVTYTGAIYTNQLAASGSMTVSSTGTGLVVQLSGSNLKSAVLPGSFNIYNSSNMLTVWILDNTAGGVLNLGESAGPFHIQMLGYGGSGWGGYGTYIDGLQVLRGRQTGPGNPSFSTLADAQTWCQNLYNALKQTTGHGLIT